MRPETFAPKLVLLLSLFLVSCSSSSGPALPSFARAMAEVERAYIERPELGLVAIGAAQALSDLAPNATISLTASVQETIVTYGEIERAHGTITFPYQMSRDEALADLTTLFRWVLDTTPGVKASDFERKMIERGLQRLDPESVFLDAEALREGPSNPAVVGLELTERDGSLTVVSSFEGSPAERAGIQASDRIVQIDGWTTASMPLRETVKRLRGRPGSSVRLAIERDSWPTPQEIEVTRVQMRISCAFARDLGDGIVYVRIRQMGAEAPSEVESALKPFKPGMKALILDLRSNPGVGMLSAAVEVAERFLQPGKLIVYTEGRLQTQRLQVTGRSTNGNTQVPMVTLVNKGTGAGTEMVAGALQDWDRATIVGNPTFGRSSIQTSIPLGDGSTIWLTTARWFTPKGRSVEGKGITPDIAVEGGLRLPPSANTSKEEMLRDDKPLTAAVTHLKALIAATRTR